MGQDYKKIYNLWWDFLKLSDRYDQYCKQNPQPGPTWSLENSFINEGYYDQVKVGTLPMSLFPTHHTFGNVFEMSFETFWRNKGQLIKKRFSTKDKPVEDLKRQYFEWTIDYEDICDARKQDPVYEDFKEFIFRRLSHETKIHLAINLMSPIGEITKAIKQSVNRDVQKKLSDIIRNAQWERCCQLCMPTPNLRISEVDRYLEVLKVFKRGLRGKFAYKEIFPNGDYDEDTDQRTVFYSDRRKGERILKNVEKGFFPGIYEKKS